MNNKFIKEKLNRSEEDIFAWDIISITPLLKSEYKKGDDEILSSYLNAAKSVYNCISEQNHLNGPVTILRIGSLVVPFMFLCRHTIELAIKFALDKQGIEYDKIHDLKTLFFKLELKKNTDKKYYDLMNIFWMLDKNGVSFRYYEDLKSKKEYIDRTLFVNTYEIINTTEELVNYLLNKQ